MAPINGINYNPTYRGYSHYWWGPTLYDNHAFFVLQHKWRSNGWPYELFVHKLEVNRGEMIRLNHNDNDGKLWMFQILGKYG